MLFAKRLNYDVLLIDYEIRFVERPCDKLFRCPGRRCLIPFTGNDSPLVPSIGIHYIYLVTAVPVRAEHHIPSIRGPAGVFIIPLVLR